MKQNISKEELNGDCRMDNVIIRKLAGIGGDAGNHRHIWGQECRKWLTAMVLSNNDTAVDPIPENITYITQEK